MISIFRIICAGVCLCAQTVQAAPRVITDIAPVHSLVAQVMDGVGEPALLLPPSASPHDYALRPSEARELGNADMVFWVGHSLTPWLEKPLDALAGDAQVIEFLEAEAVSVHGYAEHGHGHDHGDEDHKDGDDPHEAADPHIWLDPVNAEAMLSVIADALIQADAENAALYRENAARAQEQLRALTTEIRTTLKPVKSVPYLVFHDAYQYFEERFDIGAIGAITIGDAVKPGARRIAEVRHMIDEASPVCAFAEPQFPQRKIQLVLNGSDTRLGILDPLGAKVTPGPDLYASVLRGMATAMRDCLSGS